MTTVDDELVTRGNVSSSDVDSVADIDDTSRVLKALSDAADLTAGLPRMLDELEGTSRPERQLRAMAAHGRRRLRLPVQRRRLHHVHRRAGLVARAGRALVERGTRQGAARPAV